jgi:uridine kinase
MQDRQYFESVQLNPLHAGRIVLDEKVIGLTQILLAGLAAGRYSVSWVNLHFFFDLRSFIFYPRTRYYSPAVFEHFGGTSYRQFTPRQTQFAGAFDIGYAEFKQANQEIDQAFIDTVKGLIGALGTPILMTLAGPTGAGKTEIVSRLSSEFQGQQRSFSSLEVDNFFKDRDYRDQHPLGPQVMHFEMFRQAVADLRSGRSATIPRYNFYSAISSHDVDSQLRPGAIPLTIPPADIIFLEGNFPFHIPEVSPLVGLKIVYLTDDPQRLQRKWKRDIDYRKKYDPVSFCNRYFRSQFLRADDVYRPLMQVCDMVVNATQATLWLTPDLQAQLNHLKV